MTPSRVGLLIGTRKGLFIARSDERLERWTLDGPHLAGYEIYHAIFDPRHPNVAYAACRHTVWGVHVHRSDDAGRTWRVTGSAPHHRDDEQRGVEAIWYLAAGHASEPTALYAGIEPAGLFRSEDGGDSWQALSSLNEHPTRETWQPAKGGLALHSIYVDPREPKRIYAAVSAGGVYRSDDAGANWRAANQGVRADYLPDPLPPTGHCVHRVVLHPAAPDRLYQQSHCGTYRSDDRGESWTEITAGLPSDFGYAVATDPSDPDCVYVIPEESSHVRATVGGAIIVYRSRDAGVTWTALTSGLPQENAYVTILREAIDTVAAGRVFFGTSSGHLFGSVNAGDDWKLIASFLPKILSVNASPIDER